MRIVKPKLEETREHAFEKSVYEREVAKAIPEVGDYYLRAEANVEDTDVVGYRKRLARPDVQGIDITTTPIRQYDKLVDAGDRHIPVRLYQRDDDRTEPRACLIYIHGGGFMGGDIPFKENNNRYIAEQGDIVVISVEYRLTPETAWPGQIEDCMAVVNWAYDNAVRLGIDAQKIAVAGDSAGGTLAAEATLYDDRNIIKRTVLIYAGLDFTATWDYDDFEMCEEQRDVIMKRLWSFRSGSDAMNELYVRGKAPLDDPRISAQYSYDVGEKFGKTLMIEAEFDMLRFQMDAFARKLEAAGVDVTEIYYEGLDHGFYDRIGSLPQCADALEEIAKFVAEM